MICNALKSADTWWVAAVKQLEPSWCELDGKSSIGTGRCIRIATDEFQLAESSWSQTAWYLPFLMNHSLMNHNQQKWSGMSVSRNGIAYIQLRKSIPKQANVRWRASPMLIPAELDMSMLIFVHWRHDIVHFIITWPVMIYRQVNPCHDARDYFHTSYGSCHAARDYSHLSKVIGTSPVACTRRSSSK